jgi:protein SHQ1
VIHYSATMPITPRFEVDQTDDFIKICIHVPHIRVSSSEFHVEGKDFTFHCKPYFLKLSLPHEIFDDDDTCKAVYDPDEDRGVIRVTIPKKESGLHFPGLDLQTQLLQLRLAKDQKAHAFPSIEVLGEEQYAAGEEGGKDEDDDKLSPSFCPLLSTTPQNFYGFNSQYTQVLTNLREETAEMTSLHDPEHMSLASRQQLRRRSEEADFDADRYLGDLQGGEEDFLYVAALDLPAHWDRHWALWKAAKEGSSASSGAEEEQHQDAVMREEVFGRSGGFSQEERDTMIALPRRQYLVARQSPEERVLLLGLADILFAYCYDHRITQGDPTVS